MIKKTYTTRTSHTHLEMMCKWVDINY